MKMLVKPFVMAYKAVAHVVVLFRLSDPVDLYGDPNPNGTSDESRITSSAVGANLGAGSGY